LRIDVVADIGFFESEPRILEIGQGQFYLIGVLPILTRVILIINRPFSKFNFSMIQRLRVKLLGLSLFFSGIASTASAQSEIKWLGRNLIDFTLDSVHEGLNEFKGLKRYIGDSRIVLLGEQSHGDGTTFETKVKLVKYLHQEMGFSILAFESNQYNAERAWEYVMQNKSPMLALQRSIHPIWSEAREIQPLFNYLLRESAGKNPLILSGFDCQALGWFLRNEFKNDLIEYLKEKKINFPDSVEQYTFFRLFDEIVYNKGYQDIKRKVWAEKVAYWDSLKGQVPEFKKLLEAKAGQLSAINEPKAMLFSRFLLTTKNYLPQILYENLVDKTIPAGIRRNLRDSLMAENVMWLANEYYPGKKIIVWAANYHLAKHKTIGYGDLKETLMGDYIRRELDKETYTIAFTAYEGNIGWYNGRYLSTLSAPKEGSVESLFFQTGKENFFLDFKTNSKSKKGKWLLNPMFMRPLGYVEQKKSWPLVFDAVIFNRTMRKVNGIVKKE